MKVAGMIGVAAATGYLLAGRQRQLNWGATGAELVAELPGDQVLARPDLVATRSISVAATPPQVWPWLAQLGQGRGGLYSYDVLENLVGCDMHSADDVLPEHQRIAVGDEVRLHPQVPLRVIVVERDRALVLRGGVPMGDVAPPYDFTWSFVLISIADGTTRLVVRERYRYLRPWAAPLVETVQLASFVMTRKMLRGIRDRAQRISRTGLGAAA